MLGEFWRSCNLINLKKMDHIYSWVWMKQWVKVWQSRIIWWGEGKEGDANLDFLSRDTLKATNYMYVPYPWVFHSGTSLVKWNHKYGWTLSPNFRTERSSTPLTTEGSSEPNRRHKRPFICLSACPPVAMGFLMPCKAFEILFPISWRN